MNLSGLSVAVFGAGGMLAADVIPLLLARGVKLTLLDRVPGEKHGLPVLGCDLTKESEVSASLAACKPQLILNLAAYTAVDAAEKEYNAAFAVNGMGPGFLARWCKKNSCRLIHVSTDYVFGGDEELKILRKPIPETRVTSPCGIYGESKRMGEELVLAHGADCSVIVRTSWLHGLNGPNFVDTIRRVLHERKNSPEKAPLRVVNDQFGSPTWCPWLATVLLDLAEKDAVGIFHACSHGDISWQDFAAAIAEIEKIDVPVLPQSSAELNRPAPRPPYSTLDVQKLESFLGRSAPSWREGLELHLAARREVSHV